MQMTHENPRASVRLIDFGISRATQDAHSTFIQGTVSWAAPEVLQAGDSTKASESSTDATQICSPRMKKNKSNVTTSVDVYSFAYLLWALLTEREPHSNFGQSVELIKSQVRSHANCPLVIPTFDQLPDSGDNNNNNNQTSPSSSRFDVGMFEAFKNLILRCWQSEPNKRPTMAQVVEEIKKIQNMIPK